ncbi:MAG: zinc metallopeptidase [Proteobacteria bacterium]|nr:zinc metallopeptidase [Burkholderiales bacterium]
MRLEDERQSSNVEDRRGARGLGGMGRGIGIGSVAIAFVAFLMGADPATILSLLTGGGSPSVSQQSPQTAPIDDEPSRFVRRVLARTEDAWGAIFRAGGAKYQEPTLVLFSGATQTACGVGQSAMGPFYCPADRSVYIDLSFNEALRTKFGAPGEFAQAYVIAHEVGHHVQNLLGTAGKVDELRRRSSEKDANALSVRMELQADCYAGVWARTAEEMKSFLDRGDIEQALRAAAAIGDDRLQKQTRGQIVPDSFTHGSSEQRVRWFKIGFENGSVKACDTFNTRSL